MLNTTGEIFSFLEAWAPVHTAMGFDNPGLLVGDGTEPVSRVLVSLDITPPVVEEARTKGAQLIVSHHPVIFHPLRRLSPQDPAYLLARYGISAVCMHTNLDMAEGGVNTCLAQALGLQNVEGLERDSESGLFISLIGSLERPMSPREFAAHVKASLGCGGVRFAEGAGEIRRAALCGGAGGDFLAGAVRAHADAFVTGEVKHHEFLAAQAAGITIVEAGHFSTENPVTAEIQRRLAEAFPAVSVLCSEAMRDPAQYL